MANFEVSYNRTGAHEGGYTDNQRDKGNWVCSDGSWVTGRFPFQCKPGTRMHLVGTNWGISAPKLYAYLRRLPTAAEMRSLSKSTAKEIYRRDEWTRIKGDMINSQAIADILFDGAVNHGSSSAIRMMQRVLKVKTDGVMGPQTLTALNGGNEARIYNAYKAERKRLYEQLVARDSSQGVFLTGWLRRINSFDDFPGNTGFGGGGVLAGVLLLIGIMVLR